MEVLSGIVQGIVYKSEETGYVVAKLNVGKDIFTITGNMLLLKESQNIKATGEWITHKQYGQQFKVESFTEVLPESVEGIEKYLSTGVIRGIGPITAKKIVAQFGDKTLKILDDDINKLREVEGIGEKKFEIIRESYEEQKDLKEITMFFQEHGISINQTLKIYKKYGLTSIDVVKENPYRLCEDITGIGFLTSDRIAKSIGIEDTSEFRIQTGIKYVLNQYSLAGNTYMPIEKVVKECMKVLGVEENIVRENIGNSAIDGKIKIEMFNDEECVSSLLYYFSEVGITERIANLCMYNFQNINTDVDYEINQFEKNNSIKFADSQKEAIKGAFINGIEIITGGPGTGKTTIIKAIIEIYEGAGKKVLLAAPTGRAAKRMSESTGRESKTIHRLLEMGVSDDGEDRSFFNKGESEPLEGDVIIIDEASMIDVLLMYNLLKAIKLGTRIIIVGDVDQLPSVGAGNVLNDLIESEFIKVFRLGEIFRQGKESMIVTNAHLINDGKMPILNRKDGDFFFDGKEDTTETLKTVLSLINTRLTKFNSKWDKIRDMQVLTPTRKGELGVQNLNNEIQKMLNPPSKYKKEKVVRDIIFREGDKIMQTKNNYELKWKRIYGIGEDEGEGVFNGDMGFIRSISDDYKTIVVIFDEEREVIYDNISSEELELAYAITIHKSQGSEFKVVIIPSFMGPPLLLNRNLLYTGITRAREMVVITGKKSALNYMVNNTNSMERYSSLKYRLDDVKLLSDD
ncbi:MAG: ATP-dependent RecD-like DNA helicase [Clostridium sp.]